METTDKESSAAGTDNRPLTRWQQHSEIQTYDNHFFDNMHLQVSQEIHGGELLDSDVDSVIDDHDNTIPYHQYELNNEVKSVPTDVSSVIPGGISMITILDDLRSQLEGYIKTNEEQSFANDSLKAGLERYKTQDLHKSTLGHSNPLYLKSALLCRPTLYLGDVIVDHVHTPFRVYDSEETLVQAEVSRTKMLERMKDPLCKVSSKPINYAKLNSLYDTFVPQKQLSSEHVYWLPANEVASYNCNQSKPVTTFVRTRPAKRLEQLFLRKPKVLAPGLVFHDAKISLLKKGNNKEANTPLPKEREVASTKPHHMIAPGSSRYSSNDMVHNHYLEEAKKQTHEIGRNSKTRVIPSAISQSTVNGSKPKPRINNQKSRNWPASKTKRQIPKGHRFSIKKTSVVHEKTMTPRSCLRWKPTGKIFKIVGLRWVPTGKIFTSSTTKVDSEPTNGSDEDITNQYEYKQTLDVSAGTPNLSASTSFNPKKEGLGVWTQDLTNGLGHNDAVTEINNLCLDDLKTGQCLRERISATNSLAGDAHKGFFGLINRKVVADSVAERLE
ncbi:hypothetical protein Tco_1011354 [Tanacetum coccineum]